ncbi:ANKRD50 [Symbiodinium natans]|uniref:ANKRD50 protein n=1 Tax=Symbiodinium natans TaxID=878477 RepID=A0A812U3J6_9DINO|nr:ANKRD50 [Symbiodinium natans]
MAVKELQGVLGSAWQRSLRRLPESGLLRAAVLLARADRPPEGSGCDVSVWPEARRQRMEAVLQQILEGAPDREELSTRDWASMLWSTARCRAKAPAALLEAASRRVASSEASGDVQSSDVARCFWAAASLRWREPAFLEGAERLGRSKLDRCTEQDLSNIAWASATLGFNPSHWLAHVVSAFAELPREGSCSPQAIANILWGMAKAHEGGFGDEAFQDLAMRLEPAIAGSLPAALPQHVANTLWALAKLDVTLDPEGALLASLSTRMCDLLEEAEIQHLATSAWGLARLHGTQQASGRSRDFLCRLADYLRRRVRPVDRSWHSRWDGIFLSHVSIICWSYARVLPSDKVTRQLLKSASKQLESFTSECAIKAQEHANLLWAYAQAAEHAWAGMQKPRVMLGALVQLLCDPKLKLQGESAISFAASASALSRIRQMIGPAHQRALQLWLERSSGRLSRRANFELDKVEVISLLRALVACSKLQNRMMSCCLQVLQKDCGDLTPSHMLAVLTALQTLRPRRLNEEQLWFLRLVHSRLADFPLPLLTLALWRLHGIQGDLADGTEVRQTIQSGTSRFRDVKLRWPGHAPWRGVEAKKPPGQELEKEVDLSMEEWLWLANSALPCPLLKETGEQMPWTSELLQPFSVWVATLVDELATEADLLVGTMAALGTFLEPEEEQDATPEDVSRRNLMQETVLQRYRAVLRRDGLEWTGPAWAVPAAQRLGLAYCPVAGAPPELKAFLTEENPNAAAWLQAKIRLASGQTDGSGEVILQYAAEDGDPQLPLMTKTDVESPVDVSSDEEELGTPEGSAAGVAPALVPGQLVAGRDAAGLRPEFQVLSRLAAELAKTAATPDDVSGKVFLYTTRAPCLSCLGAMRQLRTAWPGLAVEVSFGRASEPWSANRSLVPLAEGDTGHANSAASPSGHPSCELEVAIRRFLESSPVGTAGAAPVALVGTDPRVRELWKQVCATGVRPSGKGTPRKKREWQDKLKYFISHRSKSFCLEEGENSQAWVRLRLLDEGASSRDEDFSKLRTAIQRTMAELLRSGKASRDHRGGEGYVLVEDVACTPRVYQLWHRCRSDSSDRLAFYLRHAEAFEVWTPGLSSAESSDQEVANLRSAVRIRLDCAAKRERG